MSTPLVGGISVTQDPLTLQSAIQSDPTVEALGLMPGGYQGGSSPFYNPLGTVPVMTGSLTTGGATIYPSLTPTAPVGYLTPTPAPTTTTTLPATSTYNPWADPAIAAITPSTTNISTAVNQSANVSIPPGAASLQQVPLPAVPTQAGGPALSAGTPPPPSTLSPLSAVPATVARLSAAPGSASNPLQGLAQTTAPNNYGDNTLPYLQNLAQPVTQGAAAGQEVQGEPGGSGAPLSVPGAGGAGRPGNMPPMSAAAPAPIPSNATASNLPMTPQQAAMAARGGGVPAPPALAGVPGGPAPVTQGANIPAGAPAVSTSPDTASVLNQMLGGQYSRGSDFIGDVNKAEAAITGMIKNLRANMLKPSEIMLHQFGDKQTDPYTGEKQPSLIERAHGAQRRADNDLAAAREIESGIHDQAFLDQARPIVDRERQAISGPLVSRRFPLVKEARLPLLENHVGAYASQFKHARIDELRKAAQSEEQYADRIMKGYFDALGENVKARDMANKAAHDRYADFLAAAKLRADNLNLVASGEKDAVQAWITDRNLQLTNNYRDLQTQLQLLALQVNAGKAANDVGEKRTLAIQANVRAAQAELSAASNAKNRNKPEGKARITAAQQLVNAWNTMNTASQPAAQQQP